MLATGIGAELKPVRNVKPLWGRAGTVLGVVLGGFDMWCEALFGRSFFGTLKHRHADADTLLPSGAAPAKRYDKPDGKVTFDRNSSVFLANLSHDEDQPVHLEAGRPGRARPRPAALRRAGAALLPGGRLRTGRGGGAPVFRIHAANCVHCKTRDIKDPARNNHLGPARGWFPPACESRHSKGLTQSCLPAAQPRNRPSCPVKVRFRTPWSLLACDPSCAPHQLGRHRPRALHRRCAFGRSQDVRRRAADHHGQFLAGREALADMRTEDAARYFSDAVGDWDNPILVERSFIAYAANGQVTDSPASRGTFSNWSLPMTSLRS